MNELDFTFELTSDHLTKSTEEALFIQSEERLKRLADNHNDMVGAAINIRRPAHGETIPLHEAHVVVYARPTQVVAIQKAPEPELALKQALDAVERQIRSKRAKLKKPWEQPGNHPVEQEIETIIAAEFESEDETLEP